MGTGIGDWVSSHAIELRRDIFAAVAMHGLFQEEVRSPDIMAHIAYQIADAMIEASNREKKEKDIC